MVAGLLALFLGAFGIHHFYLGSNIAGVVYGMHANPDGSHDWRAIWMVPAVIAFVAMVLFALAFREKLAPPQDEQSGATAPVLP